MKRAKQAMTNSYGSIENSYKQQNAAKKRADYLKRRDMMTQGLVKMKTYNKMKRSFDKKINVLQSRVTKLENVIKELTQHRENV